MSGMADWQAKVSLDIDDLKKRAKVAEGELDKLTKENRKVKLDIDTKTLESAIQKLDKMLDSLGKGTGDFKQFENLSKELSAITSEVQSFSKAFGKIDDSGTKSLLSSIQNIDRSLSELSQNILNVNKNMGNMGGNTNGAVKQVENISKASKEVTSALEDVASALEDVAKAQEKISNNKTNEREKQVWNDLTKSLQRYSTVKQRIASGKALSTDNEEATKLLDHIRELQRLDILPTEKLNASNEKLRQIDKTVSDLKSKLKETTIDSVQNSIDKYQKAYDKYASARIPTERSTSYQANLQNLESSKQALVDYKAALSGVDEITKEQQNIIKELTKNCEQAANAFKNMSATEKGATELGIEKAIQRINTDLEENTRYSAKAKSGLKALLVQLESGDPSINLKNITSEIIKIENAEIAAGRAGKSFFDIFKTKSVYGFIGQMQSYLSMYVGFYGMINGAKSAASTIVKLDDALVDLKKTTAMNSSELEQFYYDSNSVAKQMGVTTEEIINQAAAWSRLSYSSKEASTEMAKLSSQFASISPGMDTTTAQEDLVSIMRAYDIDPSDVKSKIMDKINVLGNNFAESNNDVAEGLKRSAAAMAAMNQSFEDTAALFTGGMEILQDADSMGTALRTMSMRIRGYDEETEQLSDDLVDVTGKVADLTKTTKNAQGISLFTDATQEHYKSMVQYLGEISDEWSDISEKNQNELLQQLFGKNRANAGAAIIKNFSQVRSALEQMEQSAGSSDREMSIIEDSISYRANKLKETWTGIVQQILDRGDLGTIVDGLTKISEAIGFATSKLGLLKTAAIGIAGCLSFNNIGKCYVSA